MKRFELLICVLAALPITVAAHGGRTNAQGCHNDNRNGGYHCHNGSAPRPPSAPVYPQGLSPQRLRPEERDDQRQLRYANCSEARAAGAAPVRRGDPGYGPHLDRDNDGIGCEPYRGR